MKSVSILLIALTLIALPVAAQTKGNAGDQEAIKSIALKWQDCWNRHDWKALTALVAEDVDFITVGGNWRKNRKEFEEHHANKRHEMQYKKAFGRRITRKLNSSDPMLWWLTSSGVSRAIKIRTERRASRDKEYLPGLWKSGKESG